MTLGARILLGAALLCFLLLGLVIAAGLQPLAGTRVLQVVYGEHEDFHDDAVVYRRLKPRNDGFFLLHLPRARPAYRWWAVDFRDMTIRSIDPPRSAGTRRFLLRGEPAGIPVDAKDRMGEWTWHFTAEGASFAGNGLTCSMRKTAR
jgi:hypothetical protein